MHRLCHKEIHGRSEGCHAVAPEPELMGSRDGRPEEKGLHATRDPDASYATDMPMAHGVHSGGARGERMSRRTDCGGNAVEPAART